MKNKLVKNILSIFLILSFFFSIFSIFNTNIISWAEDDSICTNALYVSSKNAVNNDFNEISVEDLKSLDYEELVKKSAKTEGISVDDMKSRIKNETELANVEIAEDILLYNQGDKKIADKYLGLDFHKIAKEFENDTSINEISKILHGKNLVRIFPISKIIAYSQNNNFKMQFGADIKLMRDYGTHEVIIGIAGDIWSRAVSGSHSYTWNQLNSYHTMSNLNKKITVTAMGYIEMVIAISNGVAIDIPGFSVNTSTSSNYHLLSDNITGNTSYTAW